VADRSYVLANGQLRLTLGPDAANDTETLVSAYLS
jgi:ABC-type branched-subunit amino acid transport system ATPase component